MQKIKKFGLKILTLVILLAPLTSFAVFIVETEPATNILANHAQLNGIVDMGSNNNFPVGVQLYFRYGTTNPGSGATCSTVFGTQIFISEDFINNGTFSKTLSALTPNTTYYFCAGSTSAAFGAPNGVVYQFTTNPLVEVNSGSDACGNSGTPTIGKVDTLPAINITDIQATLSGSVANTNLSCAIYGYLRYSTLAIPPVFCNDIFSSNMKSVTATVPKASGQIQSGKFYGVAKNLKPDTVYYYCAVASNNAFNPTEIRYGKVETFKTKPCATCDQTTITTNKPIVTGNSKATLRGRYSSTKTVKTYFEYRKHIIQIVTGGTSLDGTDTSTPATDLSWTKVNEETHTPISGYTTYGNMSYPLSGLEPDTYYKVRAVGETPDTASLGKTFYGDVLTFKTLKFNGVGPLPTDLGTGFCPAGTTGTPPDCVDINPTDNTCPLGTTGTPPNCTIIPLPTDFPTVDVIATPVPPPLLVIPITSWTISWSSTNATSCNSGGNGTGESGSFPTGTLSSSHTYTVSCTGAQGSVSDSVTVIIQQPTTIPPLPTLYPAVTVTASPQTVDPDGTSVIGWSSENADTCNTGGHGTGTSGSFTTDPLTHSHTYTITCTNPIGTAAEAVSVYVDNGSNDPNGTSPTDDNDLPSVSLIATPMTVNPLGTSVISWSANDFATACNLLGTSSSGVPTGSFTTPTLSQNHTYTVVCTGINGNTSDTVNVFVDYSGENNNNNQNNQPTVTLTATPTYIPIGGSSTIDWSSTNATVCNSGGHGTGKTGSFNTGPLQISMSYTVTCTGPQGTGSNNVIVLVSLIGGGSGDPGDDGNPGDDNPVTPICGPGTNDIDCDGIPNSLDITPNSNPTCGPGTNDIDCDGIPNVNDWDIDGDGIPNVIDSDTDGDGIPNDVDTDDDNDGIPDILDFTPTGLGTINDYDGGGIPNGNDSDMDGDGIPNVIDSDTDGDGIPNDVDTDDDNDGIPDTVDNSPTGVGTPNDYDGGGIPNDQDSDMDGDGIPNEQDPDTDGDGIPNNIDPDDDNDGIPDGSDSTPRGRTSTQGKVLKIGDKATPDIDDIVRYHEGVEHVFIRRIIKNVNLQKRYGYVPGTSLQLFAYDLAHLLAKQFGYVDNAGREIRVSKPDVSAYQLRLSGNKLTVYEYYKNKIIDIRKINASFKNKNPYEYYFRK